MSRPDPRGWLLLVAILGLGLLTAAYVIWTLEGRAATDRTTVKQLADRNAENTQAQQQLQQLVRALQGQVRKLGGTPLTQPPSPAATPPTSHPTVVVTVLASPPAQASSPQPTPRPTRTPAPVNSPTPSPSPTSTCTVKVGRVCL